MFESSLGNFKYLFVFIQEFFISCVERARRTRMTMMPNLEGKWLFEIIHYNQLTYK